MVLRGSILLSSIPLLCSHPGASLCHAFGLYIPRHVFIDDIFMHPQIICRVVLQVFAGGDLFIWLCLALNVKLLHDYCILENDSVYLSSAWLRACRLQYWELWKQSWAAVNSSHVPLDAVPPLRQWFSKWGPRSSTIRITWTFIRIANYGALPQTSWIRNFAFETQKSGS